MSFGENSGRVRALVPRWRSLTNTPTIETIPTARFPEVSPSTVSEFENLLEVWRANDRACDAVDIMDAGIATGSRRLVVEGAKRVLRHADDLRDPIIQRANSILFRRPEFVASVSIDADASDRVFKKINSLKKALENSPRNALVHVEVARLYARIGQMESAERHLRMALAIAPDDRFTLRALTRFYTMMELPEEALRCLWRSIALQTDPWLLSAELAAGTLGTRAPRYAPKVGAKLKMRREITKDFSELAAGWATRQNINGESAKSVLKTLGQSFSDPTENVLAQGVWLTDILNREFKKTFPKIYLPNDAHEAKCLAFSEEGLFSEAEAEAKIWVDDQPFQLRSFLLLSFIRYVHLSDYDGVLLAVEDGLLLHPGEWGLLNYAILACCQKSDLERAEHYLARFVRTKQDDEAKIFLSAAKGAVEFLRGNSATGLDLYLESMRQSRKLKQNNLTVNAAIYLLEMICRYDILPVPELQQLEREIWLASSALPLAQQRDTRQVFASRKLVWDEIVNLSQEAPDGARVEGSTRISQELRAVTTT